MRMTVMQPCDLVMEQAVAERYGDGSFEKNHFESYRKGSRKFGLDLKSTEPS